MAKLTEKMKRLADKWLELDNLADAHYAAGYSKKANRHAAKNNAYRILQRPEVKEYIQKRLAEIESARIAKVEEVMKYLTSVMRGEESEAVVVVTGSGDGYSSAETVEKDVGHRERLKAAELIGRKYGMFTDKLDLNQSGPVQILFTKASELSDG